MVLINKFHQGVKGNKTSGKPFIERFIQCRLVLLFKPVVVADIISNKLETISDAFIRRIDYFKNAVGCKKCGSHNRINKSLIYPVGPFRVYAVFNNDRNVI